MRTSEHEIRCAKMCGRVLRWRDLSEGIEPEVPGALDWSLVDGVWVCPNCTGDAVAPAR